MTVKEKRYKDKIAKKQYFVKHMDYLGLSKKYMGYYQMADILHLMINENLHVVSFSRQVYPIIAMLYNKSEATIERNIRNLIDKCWEKAKEKLSSFWVKKEKPSCCEFIHLIKNYIVKQFA